MGILSRGLQGFAQGAGDYMEAELKNDMAEKGWMRRQAYLEKQRELVRDEGRTYQEGQTAKGRTYQEGQKTSHGGYASASALDGGIESAVELIHPSDDIMEQETIDARRAETKKLLLYLNEDSTRTVMGYLVKSSQKEGGNAKELDAESEKRRIEMVEAYGKLRSEGKDLSDKEKSRYHTLYKMSIADALKNLNQ